MGKPRKGSRTIRQRSPGLILVLEEDQELRDGIASLLRADQYSVLAAREEEEAILRAKGKSPDLILVGRSGTNALDTARKTREGAGFNADTPIVIFSEDTIPEGAETEIEANVYVTRPDNFNQLRALLRRLISE